LVGNVNDLAEFLTDSIFVFADFLAEAFSSLLLTIFSGEVYMTYFYASFLGVFGGSTGFETGFMTGLAGVAVTFAFEGVATI